MSPPHAYLMYHYFEPDDVISARLFGELAEGLVARGWRVTALPCNRGCRDESVTRPASESWRGVEIRRVWRPRFKQASNAGRLLNAGWMVAAWGLRAATEPRRAREVAVVGSDPVLGVLAALPWSLWRRRTKLAHWCHDLYPEAPVADGMARERAPAVRLLKSLLAQAYRRCGLVADLGPCMRERLGLYRPRGRQVTLTPWALAEPPRPVEPDPATRAELFGDAKLGLLYSGNFGRAHSHGEFLDLARRLRSSPVRLCFAGRGNRVDELRAAVRPDDANVGFAGFAPESELENRLGACDLHLVSLRPEWAGAVVPSKFFGALATGRGVVYAGPPSSAIARWVEQHKVGWVLTERTAAAVAADLAALAADPGRLAALRERCHAVYHAQFSKRTQLDRWDAELRRLLAR